MKPGDLVDMKQWFDDHWMLETWYTGAPHQTEFLVSWERGVPAMVLRIDDDGWCELLIPGGRGWILSYMLIEV